MSIVSHYRNLDDTRTEQSRSHQQKKLALIEKMKKKKDADSPSIPMQETTKLEEPTIDYKALYKKTKKELDRVAKDLKNEQTTQKQQHEKENTLKQKLQQSKQEHYATQQENERIQKELASLKEQFSTVKEQLAERTRAIKTQREQHNKAKQKHRKEENHFKQQLAGIQQANKKRQDLKRQLKQQTNQLNHVQVICRQQEKKIHSLEKVVSHWQNQTPSTLLNLLFDQLDGQNIQKYERLQALYQKYFLIQEHLQASVQETTDNTSTALYGFVERVQGKWVFIDLEGKRYETVPSRAKLSHRSPVSALVVESSLVFIRNVYHFQAERSNRYSKHKTPSTRLQPKVEPVRQNLGQGVRVLVLTSTNGTLYRDYLNQHGFQATWHDPYEKNERHTHIMMDKFDIVLLFWDSIPHSSLRFIPEENNPKYVYIKTQEKEKILHRAYFAGRELGLLPSSSQ